MKRPLFSMLFVAMGALLIVRVGMHLWPDSATVDPSAAIVHARAHASVKIAAVSQPDSQRIVAATAVEPSATATEQDGWTLIESYLIPEVTAAAADAAPQESVIDDNTLRELRALREQLQQRSKQLDVREQALEKSEAQLQQRITELEQLEASIQQRLADESKVKSKKIKRLTAVYEGMKPEKAAPIIAQMELATVVKIFLLMDEKKVGKIISFLPPEKAVTISQALTRRISSVQ